ncbi:MAG: CHASE2 domain-containing protein, partial [Sulfurimonas sp.]|nr:CHASE2 domain-containing protein [Sulfurimonas sp.]
MFALNKKRSALYVFLAILIIAGHYYIYKSDMIKVIDYEIYDIASKVLKKTNTQDKASNVVVVDIDEKSLNTLGQWPWPRVLTSQLLLKINSSYPSAIGIDILFPEKDRTSPKEITSFYKKYFNIESTIGGIPKGLFDNDAIFNSALTRSKSVMSMYLSQNSVSNNECKVKRFKDIADLEAFDVKLFNHALCNTKALRSTDNYTGFVNVNTDEDGVLRRMPLFLKYKKDLIPSLSLATLLSIDSSFKLLKNGNFQLLNYEIKTDNETNVLLNFYNNEWYKKVSAIDLLNNRIPKSILAGKVILIGSSANSLHDQVIITGGENTVGVKVHVTMIDNIMNGEYLIQPEHYKKTNMLISLLLILLLGYLQISKHNYSILALFVVTLIAVSATTLVTFENNIYISIAYFIVPFLLHFFIVIIISVIINTYEKHILKEELNRIHIAQLDQKIKERTAQLEHSHKHIRDNINYASLIQNAILPEEGILEKYTDDSFVFWKPKDTVGGDIYLVSELDSKKEILIMVIDGSGHGVTGAFVTMLVKAIESQIVGAIESSKLAPSPSLILEYFNRSIKTMLKQEKGSKSNAGFDGGILYYNKETNICKYAGAKTPLYIINDDNIEIIKSDRKNVGFVRTKVDQTYSEYDIEIKD